jgi:hypothetical protein
MALHDNYTMGDILDGTARILRCPACGQLEIWGEQEYADHGVCRTRGVPCPLCPSCAERNDTDAPGTH